MAPLSRFDRRRGVLAVVALAMAVAFAAIPAARSVAGDLDKLGTSLSFVPADAAFYSASLRIGQQIDAVCRSNAMEKIKAMPYVQLAMAMYTIQSADPESPAGQLKAALNDPEVKKLLALGREMVSDEVFVFGDAGFVDALGLVQNVMNAAQLAPLSALSTGAPPPEVEKARARAAMATLCANLDALKAPALVVGFRLKNTTPAREQLDRLEQLLQGLIDSEPDLKPLAGRLAREKVAGAEYLTLKLDGSMVPWDEAPIDELRATEAKPGDAERLVEHLKKMTLVVALGIRENYLLLAVGPSTDCLARLGRGECLADRPELKPLAAFADKPLTSISYVSRPMAERIGGDVSQIEQLLGALDVAVGQVELTDAQRARIEKDAKVLIDDLKRLAPKPGATMGFAFLNGHGYEAYQYDWSRGHWLDGSKPLDILAHVGGNPVMALAGRGKNSPEDYALLVKWIKVAYGYFEEFAVPTMSPRERERFEQFKKSAGPLVARLDAVTREKLVPSLADGQVALVVDAKLKTKRLAKSLPKTPKAMPLLEPAIVLGLSDAGLFVEAMGEYLELANGLIDAIREIEDSEVPEDFRIPEPKIDQTPNGSLYGYTLPEPWGVDRQIVPNMAVGQKVAVFSLSTDHSTRMLEEKTLALGGALKGDRARCIAMLLDVAGLIDGLTPWVELGLERVAREIDDPAQAAAIDQQVHTLLEVLKVFRSVTSETYIEGDATVTHAMIDIEDVAP